MVTVVHDTNRVRTMLDDLKSNLPKDVINHRDRTMYPNGTEIIIISYRL